MAFPIPEIYASEAADIARDEAKRTQSPPSFFFARVRGLALAADYFTDARLVGGYSAVAAKHRHRFQSALLGQVMAAFEWCVKDFIAQVLDATDAFDELVMESKWIEVDKSRLLVQREITASIGALLVHPTLGWHDARVLNERYSVLFQAQPVAKNELLTLERLWLLRHSVAHNGGLITHHDAYRMGAVDVAGKTAKIDSSFITDAANFLRTIVSRLGDPVGKKILEKWMKEESTGVYATDEATYRKLKLITTVITSRSVALPVVTEGMYYADRAAAGL